MFDEFFLSLRDRSNGEAISILVYYEIFSDIREAILREKQIKAGSRKKKIDLINTMNPLRGDLFAKIF